MADPNQKPTLSKSELADICGVSAWKVGQWINKDYFGDLEKLGYKKTQQIFTPAQTEYIRKNLLESVEF